MNVSLSKMDIAANAGLARTRATSRSQLLDSFAGSPESLPRCPDGGAVDLAAFPMPRLPAEEV